MSQKGAAAVEFAIILLPLVLLMGGIIEFGIILYDQHVINNATREGVRDASNPLNDLKSETNVTTITTSGGNEYAYSEDRTKKIVDDYCKNDDKYLLINFGSSQPSPWWKTFTMTNTQDTDDAEVYYITVTATYTYNFLLPKIILLGNTKTLTSTTTMKMYPRKIIN